MSAKKNATEWLQLPGTAFFSRPANIVADLLRELEAAEQENAKLREKIKSLTARNEP